MENPSNSFDPKELSKDWFETKKFLEDIKPTGYLTLDNNFNEHIRAVLNYRVYDHSCEPESTDPTDPIDPIITCKPTAVSFIMKCTPTAVSFIISDDGDGGEDGGNGSDGDGGGDSGSGDNGGGGSGGRTLVAYWSSSDAMQENTISRNGVVHINNTEQVDVPISKKYTNNIKAQLAYLDEIAMSLHTPPVRDGFGFTAKFKGLSRSFGYAINVRYPNTAKLLRVPVTSMSKMNGDRYEPNYMLPDYAFCPAEGDPFIGITSKDANGLPIYPGILSIDGYPVGNSFIHNSFASEFGTYTTIEKDGVIEGGVPDDWGDDYIVIDTLEYDNPNGEKVVTYNCLVGDAAYNECQSIYRKMDKIPLLEESISTELRYRAESQSTYPKLTDFNFSLDYPLAYSHWMFAGAHLCYSVAAVYETNATSGDNSEPTAKSLVANIVHFALYPTFVEV